MEAEGTRLLGRAFPQAETSLQEDFQPGSWSSFLTINPSPNRSQAHQRCYKTRFFSDGEGRVRFYSSSFATGLLCPSPKALNKMFRFCLKMIWSTKVSPIILFFFASGISDLSENGCW